MVSTRGLWSLLCNVFLVSIGSYSCKVLPARLPEHDLTKSNTNRHANVDREEHTKWLSSSKWSSLKTQTGSIIQNEQVIFRSRLMKKRDWGMVGGKKREK